MDDDCSSCLCVVFSASLVNMLYWWWDIDVQLKQPTKHITGNCACHSMLFFLFFYIFSGDKTEKGENLGPLKNPSFSRICLG